MKASLVHFHFCLRLAVAGLMLVVPSATWSATSTANLNVQITITNQCLIGSTSDVNFGTTGLISVAGISATGTINVQCTLATPYNIGLDAGLGSGATEAQRKMTLAGATVIYSLYQDPTHLVVWGNTVGSTTLTGLGTGISVPIPVYGFVPSQVTPAAGVYTDTVIVTVTF
jgi:spore coat protein U-like protein